MAKNKKKAQAQPAKKRYGWLPALIAIVAAIVVIGIGAAVDESVPTRPSETDPTSTEATAQLPDGISATHIAVLEIENYGTITMALDGSAAPATVENFVKLAGESFYDGLTFHRIIEGFMMQGGDPQADGFGGSGTTIPGEFSQNGFVNPLSHTRGAVSMARSNDPDSASSQFFIVHQDSTYLDGGYAVFGYVTEGMEVVDRICADAQPIDGNGFIARDQQPVIASLTVREVE